MHCRNFQLKNLLRSSIFAKATINTCKEPKKKVGYKFKKTFEPPGQEPVSSQVVVTLIPGDGVGPECAISVQEIFKAICVPIQFECVTLSEINPDKSNTLEEVVKSIKKNRLCLKGPLASPNISIIGESLTMNMKLRQALDLYSNVVHAKTLPNVQCRHNKIDTIIIREQTEGEYSAIEHESVKGVVECYKIITARKAERIAKFAFDYAIKMGRSKVTAIHKANIMKLGDGLFLRSCEKVSKWYPRLKFDSMIVDNALMQLVSKPKQFDVMVAPNLYGHIIGNCAAGMVGGAGVVPGASYSAECAVFEQGARHIFLSAMGKNIANPTAMVLCAIQLLEHIGLDSYAGVIKAAISKVLEERKVRTKDIEGCNTTMEFTQEIINRL